jgi:hypothetical protein
VKISHYDMKVNWRTTSHFPTLFVLSVLAIGMSTGSQHSYWLPLLL